MTEMTWEQVPEYVAARRVAASRVLQQVGPQLTVKVSAFWNPLDGHVRLVGDLNDCRRAAMSIKAHYPEIADQASPEDFICIKAAAPLGVVGNVWQTANQGIGGPNPLTNSIVGGLTAGAIGYGGGALLEHLFPERYVERGKLRKALGMIGLGVGAAPGLWKGYTNARNDGTTMLRGMVTSDSAPPANPQLQKLSAVLADMPLNPQFADAAEEAALEFEKISYGGSLDVPSVPVDAFNRAVWNDVRMGISAAENPFGTKSQWGDDDQPLHTPPELGAAATGLMSGIAADYSTPVLRPRDVIAGIASAGVGLATANVAGRTLSALAGLTPESQLELQRMGMWGGLLRHVIPPIFGYR